ncbi:hypothetical protein Avbf_13003 [Armadillidium vulgare]|nr:hypothetical protein Avbf_13003 [Armadillidium vulgare]
MSIKYIFSDETRMCYFCLPEDDNQEDTKEIITYIEEQTKNEVANCSSSSITNPMNLINCTNQDMVCATITKGDSMNSDWVARTCMMIGEKSSDYIITSGVAIKRESPDIMVHFCSENKCNGAFRAKMATFEFSAKMLGFMSILQLHKIF